jgi:hypothetical protein
VAEGKIESIAEHTVRFNLVNSTSCEQKTGNQLQGLVREFSLDLPWMSSIVIVGRVEVAQETIADQISLDREFSTINRLSRPKVFPGTN